MSPLILALVLGLLQALPSIITLIAELINKKQKLSRVERKILNGKYRILRAAQPKLTDEQHKQWDAKLDQFGELLKQEAAMKVRR